MPKITGAIIRIVDRNTIIVNLGKNQGVTDDTIFSIYSKPEIIIDPQTKDKLGNIIIVKAKVKAYQVFQKFTIASTKWMDFKFPFGSGSLSGLYTEKETELNVDPSEIEPWKAISEEPIRIGDAVEAEVPEIPESEKEDESKPDDDIPF